jgi:hypothetical protein
MRTGNGSGFLAAPPAGEPREFSKSVRPLNSNTAFRQIEQSAWAAALMRDSQGWPNGPLGTALDLLADDGAGG